MTKRLASLLALAATLTSVTLSETARAETSPADTDFEVGVDAAIDSTLPEVDADDVAEVSTDAVVDSIEDDDAELDTGVDSGTADSGAADSGIDARDSAIADTTVVVTPDTAPLPSDPQISNGGWNPRTREPEDSSGCAVGAAQPRADARGLLGLLFVVGAVLRRRR